MKDKLQLQVDRFSDRKGKHPNCPATFNILGLTIIGDSSMKKIKLTQGQTALVDDEDFEELNRYKWHADKNRQGGFMALRSVRKPKYHNILMHRLIMHAPKGLDVDHINHNTLDNRKANLRICTHTQNMWNSSSRKGSSSKYKGVFWHKRDKKWHAQIRVDGKAIYLGCFTDEIEAAETYDQAAIKHFAEFAHTNLKQSQAGMHFYEVKNGELII